MREFLSAGETLILSFDMPGSLPMTFLGRRVGVASGTARLALESGAPIVPITTRRAGGRQVLQVRESIDPNMFGDAEALQAEIARRHEPAVLAWPEAVENPLRRWNPLDPEDVREFGLTREERDALLL
jgi:lauroyl/myristoyl acyltransferase